MMEREKNVFPALTGVRFVAASMVFLFHYAEAIFPAAERSFGYFFLRQWNAGVSLFFVLSGFLITYRYSAFADSKQHLGSYFLKRIARIFPLYWAVLFVHFAYLYVKQKQVPNPVTVLLNTTLLHGYSENYFFSGLTQSWSLTVEETFYLFAPLCFFLIHKRNIFLLQVPLLIAFGLLLMRLSSYVSVPFFGGWNYLFYGTFFGRCFEFFTGIFLALQMMKRSNHRQRGVIYTAGGGVLFLGLLLLLAAYAYRFQLANVTEGLSGVLLFNFLLPVSIGIFYYGLLTEESSLKTFFSSKPLLLLGKSSYAFYLLHVGVIAEAFYFHGLSNLVLLYIVLQLLSIGVYKFYEKPVYFFLLRRFGAKEKEKIVLANRDV